MYKKDALATVPWDIAVELDHVTKTFSRKVSSDSLLRNVFHPKFEALHALDAVSLTVKRGEFVAYAGPNGAGKSTTFKLLTGMLVQSAGRVRALGLDPTKERIALMRRTGLLIGNRTELWWDHPVISSFRWKKEVWEIDDATYAHQLDKVTQLLDLTPLLRTFARELSLGQRMRCDLALMLLHNPELILLDEPTLGLDVLAKRKMIEFLKTLNRDENATILVTSHDMDDLTEMARRIVMLAQGRTVYDGDLAGLYRAGGDMRTVTLTCPGLAPALSGATHLATDADRHTYQFDLGILPLPLLLNAIAALPHIRDVELGRAPLEQVVAGLYRSWGNEEDAGPLAQ